MTNSNRRYTVQIAPLTNVYEVLEINPGEWCGRDYDLRTAERLCSEANFKKSEESLDDFNYVGSRYHY